MVKDVTLTARDLTKTYGTPDQLKARLMDNNTPLSNKPIQYDINGVKYIRITGSDGYSALNINLNPGTYPCTIMFLGDTTYNSARVDVIVRVVQNTTPQQNIKSAKNYFEVNHIALHVLTKDGFDIKTGQNIKETDLLYDSNYNAPTYYFNSGYSGDEFEVSIVMKESYFHDGEQVKNILNQWNKMMVPVTVVTDAFDVPNSKYIMSIKDKKQDNKSYSIWKLRFKQYYENSLSFDSMYEIKTSSLSSLDQLLLKQRNGITDKSSSDIITALQRKLQSVGYWNYQIDGSKGTHGYWNGLPTALYRFQSDVMGTVDKQGRCDFETITALVTYSTGGL